MTPLVHHVRADGSAVLLLADDEPLLARVRGGETAVMLELVDRARGRPARTRPRAAVDHRLVVASRAARGAPDGAAGRRRPPAGAAARARPRRNAGAPGPGLRGARRRRRLRRAHARRHRRRPPGPVLPDGGPLAGPPRGGPPGGVRRPRPAPAARAGPLPRARIRPLGVDRCGLRLRVETPAARPRRAPGVPERGLDAGGAAGTAQPARGCPFRRPGVAHRRAHVRAVALSRSPAPPGPRGPGG